MTRYGPEERLEFLRRWARLLDAAFAIPGTRIRFGWDPILGLVPGLGDLATPVFAGLLLVHAYSAGVPKVVQLRMVLNVLLDVLLGLVPLAGDVADVAWKANVTNLRLLERYAGGERQAGRGDWLFVGAVLGVLGLVAAIPLVLFLWIISRFGWL